jgi:hypothetical protein
LRGTANGAHALVLDLKRASDQWARDLPTVTCRVHIADIHDTRAGLQAEIK